MQLADPIKYDWISVIFSILLCNLTRIESKVRCALKVSDTFTIFYWKGYEKVDDFNGDTVIKSNFILFDYKYILGVIPLFGEYLAGQLHSRPIAPSAN